MTTTLLRRPRVALWRRVALPAGVAAPVVAAAAYVAAVSPFTHHYATCPVLDMFGVYCPGCGGLRAAHSLTRGDVVAALDLNAFAVVFGLVVASVWLWWLVARVRGRPLHGRLVPVVLFASLFAIPVFTVVRNLPFGQLLAP